MGEWGARAATVSCALLLVIVTAGIVYVLASQALPFFAIVSPQKFYTGTEWQPVSGVNSFGVLPLVTGSLIIMAGACLIALPLGVLGAIYLSEYASPSTRIWFKLPLELLAGIPTVVYGYIGLFYVTPVLRQLSSGFQASNAASAAIVVGLMILPLVSSVCEDAIHSVPRSLREGGYALGLTKFEVLSRIVLPSASSGIAAAFVLALARAVGETMAVTLAAGSTPNLTLNPQKGMATMTSYIVTTSQGEAAGGSLRQMSMFAVGITLFGLTLVLNVIAMRLVSRFRRRLT